MSILNRKDHIIMFVGDICVLLVSLVMALSIRYVEFPSMSSLRLHLAPFSILFFAFVLIYFIAGLYDKHTSLFKKRLPFVLLNVQLVNTIVGIAFFYLIPYFSIAPKTVLFLFLVLSLILMYSWRIFMIAKWGSKKPQNAILIADSVEANELKEEINSNSKYDMKFVEIIKPSSDVDHIISTIRKRASENGVSLVVIDMHNPLLSNVIPSLYPIAMKGLLFFDIGKIYENVFDRIPVSMSGKTWFIEHMSSMAPKLVYDGIKRLIDIVVAFIVGLVSLLLYPFIIIAMKIEDERAPIFSYQKRIGQYNKIIKIVKFRTMTVANDDGKWGSVENKVTQVGAFLRKTRLDELPQLWNVFRGDISLIGPRPEFPPAVEAYSREIPNYTIRHSVKPGLSGWAQIYHEKHPHHGIDVTETSNKLSYDLYYIKHRSFILDMNIALRTIRVLFTFIGR